MLNTSNYSSSRSLPSPLRTRYKPNEQPLYKVPKPAHQGRLTFNKEAFSNLSLLDGILFERFGRGSTVQVPQNSMHRAFEAQVAMQPEAIAVAHLGLSITYGELDRQANRLAAILAQHGVKTGDNVALFLQRSIPMIVGILATLKAGAAYVPQHVGVAPEAHLNYVLETAGINIILTLSHLQALVPVPNGRILLNIDELMQEPFADEIEYGEAFAPETAVSRDNTCFIIFTSGTTGNPNGVQVTHGNVGNILLTAPGNLGIQPGVKVGQIS